MGSTKIARVTLRETRSPDGEVSLLEAYVNEHGDLVLEGYDAGRAVEMLRGDSDYEYWRKVRRDHVPRVLTHLIKERFDDDSAFHQWLVGKGIPVELSYWE